jgi:competence protein ComEC
MAHTRAKGSIGLTNRPALWMAAALAVGIAAADLLRPHPALALAAVLASCAWAGLSRRRVTLALLLVVAALGALRFAYAQTAGRGDLAAWAGDKVELTGTVTGEPELRGPRGVGYVLTVERVGANPASGKVFVTQWGGRAPGFGERVSLEGRLKAPTGARTPGGFDQAAYLARQSVYFVVDASEPRLLGPGALNPIRRAAVAARVRLEGVLKATLPPREAALAAGLLFGTRSDLPDDVKNAFQASGVLHLLAVSGGNVAMILLIPGWVLRRLGVKKRMVAALLIPVVVFFVFLTGAGPSVMRAGLMALLVLLGEVLRREKDALNTLGAAASMLLLFWSPGLLFDVGFQLSAGATLGILLFARRFEGWLAPHVTKALGAWLGPIAAAGLSVTLAAQVLVEPISLHTFGSFSTIAPLANLLVLTLVELIVPVGSLATLVGLLFLPAARVLDWFVRLGLVGLVWLVKALAAIPGAYLNVGHLPAAGMVAWYCLLVFAAWPPARHAAVQLAQRLYSRRRGLQAAVCVALVCATGFTWRLALADPPDTLRVTFLDVGQGDALVIQAPGGRSMVVDAGVALPPDKKTGRPGFDAGAEVVVPFLKGQGIRRLDYLVLTHPDQDHAGGGAAILSGIPVGMVLKSDQGATEARYLAALDLARRKGVPVRQPVAGERIDLGGGVVLDVLNPRAVPFSGTRSDDNSNCVALRLRYRKITMLFTCDLEAEVEQALVDAGTPLRADVLKVSHHGSGHSSTQPFLEAVQPRYAVVSVGNGNSYGHPHAETLERLAGVGAQIYRTDRLGTVTARTDGLTLSVRGERGGPQDEQYHPLGLLGRRWLRAW